MVGGGLVWKMHYRVTLEDGRQVAVFRNMKTGSWYYQDGLQLRTRWCLTQAWELPTNCRHLLQPVADDTSSEGLLTAWSNPSASALCRPGIAWE